MNSKPHAAPPTVPSGMLQTIAEAICDRPEDAPAKRAVRSGMVMQTVEGFQPRDAAETMLAGLVVTHAHLVEDSARDVFRGQDDRLKARTKSTIVALGRAMFGFLRELRKVQAQRSGTAVATSGTAASAIADAMPVEALDQLPKVRSPAKAAEPITRTAVGDPLAHAKAPEQPVPFWPPLRRSETSVAAMMVVLSPPMPSYAVSRAADKPVAALTADDHAMSSAPDASAVSAQALAA